MELTDICCIGHAERLVHCVHALAVSNPQDPVPAFSNASILINFFISLSAAHICGFRRLQLRDLIDLKNCIKRDLFCLSPDASIDASGTGRGTSPLTTADIHAVQKKLKLTKKLLRGPQVDICGPE
ncbi:hypothetical protein PsorP6_010495 [Peronosclerospora sorghi]|uniref:Uncharacterized protein n=1 Tax=Peronosclerospora sorghi TaxID=230839 RepID=A0ACC0VWP6_9STRA|nr:hypothetical protein PsorP6_010495 [Peronosclerospora sorghi]